MRPRILLAAIAVAAGFVLVSCLLTAGSVYEFTLAGTFPVFGAADPPGPCAPAPCANVSGRGWRDLPLSGYGWTVKGTERWQYFDGSLPSPQTFAHSGGFGTSLWIDPVDEIVGVYLSVVVELAHGFLRWNFDSFQNMVHGAIDE